VRVEKKSEARAAMGGCHSQEIGRHQRLRETARGAGLFGQNTDHTQPRENIVFDAMHCVLYWAAVLSSKPDKCNIPWRA